MKSLNNASVSVFQFQQQVIAGSRLPVQFHPRRRQRRPHRRSPASTNGELQAGAAAAHRAAILRREPRRALQRAAG